MCWFVNGLVRDGYGVNWLQLFLVAVSLAVAAILIFAGGGDHCAGSRYAAHGVQERCGQKPHAVEIWAP